MNTVVFGSDILPTSAKNNTSAITMVKYGPAPYMVARKSQPLQKLNEKEERKKDRGMLKFLYKGDNPLLPFATEVEDINAYETLTFDSNNTEKLPLNPGQERETLKRFLADEDKQRRENPIYDFVEIAWNSPVVEGGTNFIDSPGVNEKKNEKNGTRVPSKEFRNNLYHQRFRSDQQHAFLRQRVHFTGKADSQFQR